MKKRLRKKMTKDWEWYTVKVLFEVLVSGEPSPEKMDENYPNDNDQTFEERILLVKSTSCKEAYGLAKKEAHKYEDNYLNQYDEKVEWKFIEMIDCFKLFDSQLQTGTELYARFLHVPKSISTEEVISHYYPETVVEELVDKNFIQRNQDSDDSLQSD